MQPVVFEGNTLRFKGNSIVEYLLDTHPSCNLNTLSSMPFTDEDRCQFAQLIGYSISGYSDLPYVSDEMYDEAIKAVRELINELTSGIPNTQE